MDRCPVCNGVLMPYRYGENDLFNNEDDFWCLGHGAIVNDNVTEEWVDTMFDQLIRLIYVYGDKWSEQDLAETKSIVNEYLKQKSDER